MNTNRNETQQQQKLKHHTINHKQHRKSQTNTNEEKHSTRTQTNHYKSKNNDVNTTIGNHQKRIPKQ